MSCPSVLRPDVPSEESKLRVGKESLSDSKSDVVAPTEMWLDFDAVDRMNMRYLLTTGLKSFGHNFPFYNMREGIVAFTTSRRI